MLGTRSRVRAHRRTRFPVRLPWPEKLSGQEGAKPSGANRSEDPQGRGARAWRGALSSGRAEGPRAGDCEACPTRARPGDGSTVSARPDPDSVAGPPRRAGTCCGPRDGPRDRPCDAGSYVSSALSVLLARTGAPDGPGTPTPLALAPSVCPGHQLPAMQTRLGPTHLGCTARA